MASYNEIVYNEMRQGSIYILDKLDSFKVLNGIIFVWFCFSITKKLSIHIVNSWKIAV